jgi:hypothetical protein
MGKFLSLRATHPAARSPIGEELVHASLRAPYPAARSRICEELIHASLRELIHASLRELIHASLRAQRSNLPGLWDPLPGVCFAALAKTVK